LFSLVFSVLGSRHSARCRRHVAAGCSGAAIQSRRKRPMQRAPRNALSCPAECEHSGQHARAPLLGETLALPDRVCCAIPLVPVVCHAEEATPTPSLAEAEVESVVVSATRFDIPLDQSPASASVISSEELEQKQIHA